MNPVAKVLWPAQASEQSPAMAASVSIIVATFNRANYITECLKSLLAQTWPALEIIVVDDGSADDTAARVAQFGDRVQYVKKTNGGKPSAVNLALSMAQGEWIWIFDDDDVALPDAIESRIGVAHQYPEAGFVYAPHYMGSSSADGRIQLGRLYTPPQYSPDRFFLEIMKGCFLSLSSALVRTNLMRRLGGLNPTLLSSEDYDLLIRLSNVSKAAYCKSPSFIVRQHDGERGSRSIRYSAAQRAEVFRKYGQIIAGNLRKEVGLGNFLNPRIDRDPSGDDRRTALLNRSLVMASHGHMAHCIEDLCSANVFNALTPRQWVADRALILQCAQIGYSPDDLLINYQQLRAQIFASHPKSAAKALLWTIALGLLQYAKGHAMPLARRVRVIMLSAKLGFAATLA